MPNHNPTRQISTLAIDLSKQSFQLHGVDDSGQCVLRKKLSGANHWLRKFTALGHFVRMIAPQFVTPFVKSNKNDAADAEAICEAAQRPNMRFVPAKSIEQQDIQSVHRIRSQAVSRRTALANQIRGLLTEYGVIIPKGISYCRSVAISFGSIIST